MLSELELNPWDVGAAARPRELCSGVTAGMLGVEPRWAHAREVPCPLFWFLLLLFRRRNQDLSKFDKYTWVMEIIQWVKPYKGLMLVQSIRNPGVRSELKVQNQLNKTQEE